MSWVITGVSKPPLLLDTYSGAAAAYSLRSLSLAYGGSVVRVRRSSDNTEQDFSAAQITDGTLATFCGAGNGFVRTWYDQSGNSRHAAQNVNASQPKVVDNGGVILENGKAALDFNGTSHWLVSNFGSTTSIPTTTTAVFNKRVSNIGVIYDGYSVQSILYDNIRLASGNPVLIGTSIGINEQHLSFALYNGASSSLYIDSQLNVSGNTGSNGVDGITIGNIRNNLLSNYTLDGTVQEIILYFSNQSTNRVAIEANINAHYAIY
jgi:hypothetical protein